MEEHASQKLLEFSGKSILLVEDEPAVQATLVAILKGLGFNVLVASDGLSAKTVIALNSLDVILSDIRMPNMNGIELLHHVKRTSKTPFILMTGFSDIMETKEAFKIGADNFLTKPFTKKEMVDVLSIIMPVHRAEASKPSPENSYCRIPIYDFTSGSKLKVDIYLRLSDKKYIKVAKESSELSADRLDHFKLMGLEFFFIRKEDFAKYVGLNLRVSKIISDAANITAQQKLRVLKHTAEILLQDSYVNGLDKDKFSLAKEVVNLAMDAMAEDGDISSLLQMLNVNSDFLYAHSLGVSLYSSLIAEEIGWKSTVTKFKVSMGGLLHDIGKKEIDRVILEKPRKDMNRHEIQILESHALRGRDILSQTSSVPSDVVLIALQHHENCLGRGYPGGLERDQIHPLARLVSVANRFCELALKSPSWTPLEPNDAIDRILSFNENEYDVLYIAALMKVFSHPRFPQFEKKLALEKSKTA